MNNAFKFGSPGLTPAPPTAPPAALPVSQAVGQPLALYFQKVARIN